MEYTDRLNVFKLRSTRYRRSRGGIIETYKYIHKIYKVSPCPLVLDGHPASTRDNSLKLKKIRCNKSETQKVFIHIVLDAWNNYLTMYSWLTHTIHLRTDLVHPGVTKYTPSTHYKGLLCHKVLTYYLKLPCCEIVMTRIGSKTFESRGVYV